MRFWTGSIFYKVPQLIFSLIRKGFCDDPEIFASRIREQDTWRIGHAGCSPRY
jgi:hypothetical protein